METEQLIVEWRSLPAGDRKAIRKLLTPEQRLRLQHLTAAPNRGDAEAAARDRQYRAYSNWLGQIVEDCVDNTQAAAGLKPAVRSALADAHKRTRNEDQAQGDPLTLTDHTRALLRIWRSWW